MAFIGIPKWGLCVAGVVVHFSKRVDAAVSQLEFRMEIINTRMQWNAKHKTAKVSLGLCGKKIMN